MRLRNLSNAYEIIEKSNYVVNKPNDNKGHWHDIFNNDNPIYIEIGMGKGQFIIENALLYPDINFIGIEKYSSILARAILKIGDRVIPNLRLLSLDALIINEVFDKEVSMIYLNFSDPWPKDRHEKRRLTSDVFLKLYDDIYKDGVRIIQKTDNIGLFKYSCEQFLKHNYDFITGEFKGSNIPLLNIQTEYETKFLKLGNLIYRIEVYGVK